MTFGFLEIKIYKPLILLTMKNIFISSVVLILGVILITGCQPKPVKSVENLKTAYNGESTASQKYADYAKKALEEGLDTIAKLFEATSKAESIHAANHKAALEKLGAVIEAPVIGSYEVKTTVENLNDAIKGETYEIETMYAGFLADAQAEKCKEATTTFTWARDTEKKHAEFYKKALEAASSGKESSLTPVFFVCPKCGNTFDAASVEEKCSFCMTPIEKFISI
jgi:rubrerythrin